MSQDDWRGPVAPGYNRDPLPGKPETEYVPVQDKFVINWPVLGAMVLGAISWVPIVIILWRIAL